MESRVSQRLELDTDLEWVRGGGGGLLPLDGAVALLRPDAVVVDLGLEHLTPGEVVTLDSACLACEPLDTVGGGSGKHVEQKTILDTLTCMTLCRRSGGAGC